MKTSIKSIKLLALSCMAAGLVLPEALAAESVSAAGGVTYIQTAAETQAYPDGTSVLRAISKGIVLCDDEANILHLAPQHVSGTTVMDADGKVLSSAGYGEMKLADGEVLFIWWKSLPDGTGSEWGYIGGTGKYAGIQGGGTTELVTMLTTGSQVIRWQGSWTLGN